MRTEKWGPVDVGALPTNSSFWQIGIRTRYGLEGSLVNEDRSWDFRPQWHFPRNEERSEQRSHRALIVEGYPAFDAPIAAYLLRKVGWKVDVSERAWFDAGKLAEYQLVIYDGSLTRAKVVKTAFDAADLEKVAAFLKAGGTLVLMRERNDLFASPEGRKFLEEIVGSGQRDPKAELHIRQPEHPWLKHLATSSDTPLPWLAKGTPISTSKGESLIGSDGGASVLHVAPVGKGRLIYVGWSPAASIPHGRMVSTVEEEDAFDAQVKILQGVLSSANGP
jgi:hypothetical protein